MPRHLLLLALLLLASPARAHDFWIDHASYKAAPGAATPIRLLIGDIGETEPWDTRWHKLVSLVSHGPGGLRDHQRAFRPSDGQAPGDATIRLEEEGTHVLALESYQSESDLPAAEFNAYAEHEGLTPALALRAAGGQRAARGRELYSRRAKALVQVGAQPTDDALRPVGHTLEIVPLRNPYALAAGEPLEVLVLFRGVPLPGASVAMERLDGQAGHATPVITDGDGRARLAAPAAGRWRVATVWTAAIEHPRAEFDTVFASLTFGR